MTSLVSQLLSVSTSPGMRVMAGAGRPSPSSGAATFVLLLLATFAPSLSIPRR